MCICGAWSKEDKISCSASLCVICYLRDLVRKYFGGSALPGSYQPCAAFTPRHLQSFYSCHACPAMARVHTTLHCAFIGNAGCGARRL